MIQQFVHRWVGPGRQVQPILKEIYALGGKDLTVTALSDVVAQTQSWLREKGQERWNIAGDLGSLENLKRLLGELGLSEPVLPQGDSFDKVVILGATYRTMKHRLEAFLNAKITFGHLVVIAGQRVIGDNKIEVDMLKEEGVYIEGMTEADAAAVLIETHDGLNALTDLFDMSVSTTSDSDDGGRATTDDTVRTFVSEITPDTSVLWVGHQPFFRQLLTVARVLNDEMREVQPHHTNFLLGPLLALIEENPYALIDAMGRTLYELDKLPESFFA